MKTKITLLDPLAATLLSQPRRCSKDFSELNRIFELKSRLLFGRTYVTKIYALNFEIVATTRPCIRFLSFR